MKIRQIIPWFLFVLLVTAFLMLRFYADKTGLLLGIMGALLVFGAQMFYSYRREGYLKFGKIKKWLDVHIFIGLVGPSVVLFHSKFQFKGFAGFVLILTLAVMASGIFGYYIKRLILKLVKQSTNQSKIREMNLRKILGYWRSLHMPLTIVLFITMIAHVFSVFYYGKLI